MILFFIKIIFFFTLILVRDGFQDIFGYICRPGSFYSGTGKKKGW